MPDEVKIDIEIQQKEITTKTIEFLRTQLGSIKDNNISCALITINSITGQLLIHTANSNLVADTKMLLQEGLDMLNRQQIVTSIIGRLMPRKGDNNVIVQPGV